MLKTEGFEHDFVIYNICKAPREVLKTEGFARGFKHFPQDLANANEWKIMFDPSKEMQGVLLHNVLVFFCLFF